MSRTLMFLVLALVLAVPATACVPQASSETPNGADGTQASGIKPVDSASGVEVAGRPTTIPAGMGGTINIGNNGTSTGGVSSGAGTKDPVTISGVGEAVAPPGSTISTAPGGGKRVTIPAGKEISIPGGTFDNGKEAREGGQGTLTGGGTIDGDDATQEPDGSVKIKNPKKLNPDPNSGGFTTSGGNPLVPGATTGVTVPDGKDLDDANQRYGE